VVSLSFLSPPLPAQLEVLFITAWVCSLLFLRLVLPSLPVRRQLQLIQTLCMRILIDLIFRIEPTDELDPHAGTPRRTLFSILRKQLETKTAIKTQHVSVHRWSQPGDNFVVVELTLSAGPNPEREPQTLCIFFRLWSTEVSGGFSRERYSTASSPPTV
jgi:hypothetical protein